MRVVDHYTRPLAGWAHPVRRLSARLQARPWPARPLLRPPERRRPYGADDRRLVVGLLRRPDRKEAAQSLPAGVGGAVVRHGGLQPRLRLLPEPRDLQEPRSRYQRAARFAGGDRPRGERARLRFGRLHLQRPRHLLRIRDRRRRSLPGARDQDGRGDGGIDQAGAAGRVLSRRSTPPMSTSRRSPTVLLAPRRLAISRRCSTR